MTLEALTQSLLTAFSNAQQPNATQQVQQIIASVLDKDTTWVILNQEEQIADNHIRRIVDIARDRLKGKPLAYCLGNVSFMGNRILVDSSTLIPRPETEQFVELVLPLIRKISYSPKIIDIGTGSGVIAIMLKKYFPHSQVLATDISEEALDMAEDNAQRLNVDIETLPSDLFDKIKDDNFDVIISNPPYIPSDFMASISSEVTGYEPISALDGGQDGLEIIERLIIQSADKLTQSGLIALEIWHTQGDQIIELVEKHLPDKTCRIHKDLAGFDRFALIY